MLTRSMIAFGVSAIVIGVASASDCASRIDPKSHTFALDLLTCLKSLESENNELQSKLAALTAISAIPSSQLSVGRSSEPPSATQVLQIMKRMENRCLEDLTGKMAEKNLTF